MTVRRTERTSGDKMIVRWQARWTEDGGSRQFRTFATKSEAVLFESQRVSGTHVGTWADPAAGKVTLGEWGAHWLASLAVRDSTRLAYARALEVSVVPALGHLPLRSIRPTTVQAWLRGLRDVPPAGRLADATIEARCGCCGCC